MGLIGLTLLLLGILTVFSFVLGGALSGSFFENTLDTSVIINGTTTTLEFGGDEVLFAIDPAVATITVFIVIIGIVGLLGIQILGSGLSPESIRTIMICILYGIVWGLLSVVAMPLILSIEIFGVSIYMVLLVGYIIGVIQKIGGGGAE